MTEPTDTLAEPLDDDLDEAPEPLPDPRDLARWLDKLDQEPRSQREQRAIDVFRAQFRLERQSPEDFGPAAALIAYRVTRQWLYLTGKVGLDEALTAKDVDWSVPIGLNPDSKHLRPVDRLVFGETLAAIQAHPAPVSPAAAQNGCRAAWNKIATTLARELKADRPCGVSPHVSSKTTRYLLRHETAVKAWPTPVNIIEFEEELNIAVFEKIKEEGRITARNYIRSHYGFSKDEADAAISMAMEAEQRLFRATPEQERALSIARAETAHHKSLASLDRRGAVMANKHVALVVGLARAEVDDVHADFREMARKVLPAPVIPQRPPLDIEASPSKPAD